ncbi:hypothetical protein B0G80_5385 [Paraburkholderia sp. BL6669N2]|nr:hypothetical protein B0G80_5385 [Paraburkholderia sp. BL6669N2]
MSCATTLHLPRLRRARFRFGRLWLVSWRRENCKPPIRITEGQLSLERELTQAEQDVIVAGSRMDIRGTLSNYSADGAMRAHAEGLPAAAAARMSGDRKGAAHLNGTQLCSASDSGLSMIASSAAVTGKPARARIDFPKATTRTMNPSHGRHRIFELSAYLATSERMTDANRHACLIGTGRDVVACSAYADR